MNKISKNIVFKYLLFIVGLFIASLGVALSKDAGLGTSPVSSLPYSISLVNGLLTFGGWLNLLSLLQVIVQVVVLKGKCNPIEIVIQTVLAFVYGYLTDFSCYLLRGISPDTYPLQFICMLAGCVVLAFGIWLQLKGGVAMLPGEAMNRAIAQVSGKRYENVKILFDVLYLSAGAVICLVFIGELKGAREGSIVVALLVGNIIKFYNWAFNKITK